MAGLEGQPLTSKAGFNWVFLIETLVTAILSLFFLFYFNRLFATLVSYGIRAFTWYKYKAYIDISALQISLLGGRVFFKRITYHAHNITFFVYDGHITWRYWLRMVQEAEVFQHGNSGGDGRPRSSSSQEIEEENGNGKTEKLQSNSDNVDKEEKGGLKPRKDLPCRISVKVAGVEAFIYNRSPLYDGIVEATLRKAQTASGGVDKEGRHESWNVSPDEHSGDSPADFGTVPAREETSQSDHPYSVPEIPFFLRILPIKVECRRAAAALGNENTINVITAKVERAEGTIDAGSSGPLDLFKILFNFTGEKINVAMKPNRDFKELQLNAARRILREKELDPPAPGKSVRDTTVRKTRSSWRRLMGLFHSSRSTAGSLRPGSVQSGGGRSSHAPPGQQPGQAPWHGLTRYLDDQAANEHDEWRDVEYAKASQLVDCDKVSMRFFWDIPGRVQGSAIRDDSSSRSSAAQENINGSDPPEYGMDLSVYGGFVVYGPWADRQRINLQHIFFPATYVDAVPAKRLKAGDYRVATIFKIAVTVEEDVVVRIPTREESKDHRWKNRAGTAKPAETQESGARGKHGRRGMHGRWRKGKAGPSAADVRPYAWLDVTVKKDTVVHYIMDMLARPSGYRNTLDVDVKGIEMSSSVNHGLLWRSGALTLEADLSYPLAWNSVRKWPFTIVCNDLELFILRDHLFLIIDVVNDWASGAPADFYTFVPFCYELDLKFRNFCMYLNVNDANIINEPADFDKNDFLTLEGQLSAKLGIPMEHHQPQRNQISFDVLAEDLRMRMLSPTKSTLSAFLEEPTVAILPRFTLLGSFNGNQETRVGLTDVLRMDIVGTGLTLKAFGFFVRQLVNLKENYFGDYLHFKTLEEFQGASDDLNEANAKTATFPKPQTINELDVILCIVAEDATVMLPTNMYSANEYVKAELPRADLDLRITSYYLDMGLQLSPISFLSGSASDNDSPVDSASHTQFYVSHVDLNGHRAFGHPPDELAYISQWDIDVGKVTGELSSSFTHNLVLAGRAFAFTINDAENAIPVDSPAAVWDATFVQVHTDALRLWLHAGQDAMLLAADPITVQTHDWANETFSQRVNVMAPLITFACVDGRSASRHRTRSHRRQAVKTYAFLQTGASVDVLIRKRHFASETEKQQGHILHNDERTKRASFLRRSNINAATVEEEDVHIDPPAMPYPSPPHPILKDGRFVVRPFSRRSDRSTPSDKQLRPKSSSASLSGSIRNGALGAPSHHNNLVSKASTNAPSKPVHRLQSFSSTSSPVLVGDQSQGVLPGDAERSRYGLPASTMAFSSPYTEPYFPLEMVDPDERNVPPFHPGFSGDGGAFDGSSTDELIDDPDLDHDAEHITVFIKIAPGIRAYLEPHLATSAFTLVEKVLPKRPDEVMDAYHMNVMGSVIGQQAERHGHNNIIEINASLPSAHIRVVNLDDSETAADKVDLEVQALETLVRMRTQPAESGATQVLALHTVLERLELSLQQTQDIEGSSPAMLMRIDDVLVWLALTGSNAFHVSFRETELLLSGAQASYLALLVLRLLPTVDKLKTRFEKIVDDDVRRLQLLAYILTQHGEDIGDPAFLTRMVYILRAFPHHFRNQDSWRVISRFRYILRNLPRSALEELETKGKAPLMYCPKDAPAKVVERWSQWRNWDIPNVDQTTAFRMLFGSEEVLRMMPQPESKSATVTFRSEIFRIAIQHHNTTSDILLRETSIGVETVPPTTPEGLMLVDENQRTKTTIQIHTTTVAFSLDWGLFDIVEVLVPLKDQFEAISASVLPDSNGSATQALEESLSRHEFHIVFSTENGTITLQTINLRHEVEGDGLKMSLIGSTNIGGDYGLGISAIVNMDSAASELRGPSKRIWRTRLTSPSLYIDQAHPARGLSSASVMTVAVAYNEVEVFTAEQIPGILHIVDAVVVDEVAKINRLVERITSRDAGSPQQTPQSSAPSQKTVPDGQPPKIHVALLAGKIHLQVSLLQALSYKLQGTAMSARVAPSLEREKAFGIDFDVGRLNHAFVNTSSNRRSETSIVDVPPINGHLGLELSETETSISVATTIEKIEVDAGALQSVITVLNRPEVQTVISAVKAGIEDVKSHVVDLFPAKSPVTVKPKPSSTGESKDAVQFDVRFSLLGMRFSASTPQIPGHSTAEVEFGIGPVHAKASNRKCINSLVPKVTARIQDLGASLHVKQGDEIQRRGNAMLSLEMHVDTSTDDHMKPMHEISIRSAGLDVNAYPETASTIVDVINHLQDKIKHLDLSKEVDYLRRIRDDRKQTVMSKISGREIEAGLEEVPFSPEDLLSISTRIELRDIQVAWIVDQSFAALPRAQVQDLVFSVRAIDFAAHGGHEARLAVQDVQLQLAQRENWKQERALNSALLPEVVFTVGYFSKDKDRSLAFKATGKPLDVRLESRIMVPVNALQRSIEDAMDRFKVGTAAWKSTPTTTGAPRPNLFDTKHLRSVLVEAEFAGAQVYLQGSGPQGGSLAAIAAASQQQSYSPQHGRYGQFASNGVLMHTTLTTPGIAFKLEYNTHIPQPTLNAELRVDASSNTLAPNVVPLMLEVSKSIQEVMRHQKQDATPAKAQVPSNVKTTQKFFEDESIITANPAKIFGKTKVDLGFRIMKQQFGLSCQPIARVDAKASLEDFYFTANTIDSEEHGHFFAMSAVMTNLKAQVKHVYSREPTFSYEMESVVLSAMNNKHLSGLPGISAILKINPTRIFINGKQFQDLLLFREIWLPPEIRTAAPAPSAPTSMSNRPEDFLVQRYQTVAAAAAFPWNATVSISKLALDVDLGQSIGKSSFTMTNLWASQQKTSNWEQNLCIGLDDMNVESTGRMSGFIDLQKLAVRTSIKWPEDEKEVYVRKTPLIQASVGFQRLRAKAAFDYQAFAFGDIENFDFLMYNVREASGSGRDRLVAVLDCDKAYVFCTTTSPAQAVGLYQAFDRLIQDKQSAFVQSLKEIEKHLRRESTHVPTKYGPSIPNSPTKPGDVKRTSISLHTDVVVTIGAISLGVYPSTFFDSQMLKLEANNIQARFAVGLEKGKITSGLGMTLGQLQVALASARRATTVPKALDVSVDEVISSAVNAKGGVIVRVPKVVASMQTWQTPSANSVDYIFRSLFDGKIDVGWNLSRINFIKNMWVTHSKALASRLGKAMPESAVKVTAGLQESDGDDPKAGPRAQEKITAEISLPQSKYEYHALEPPVIETPQLRDMGEATPPLEWVGLQRDRLPNVTHQIIIVSLLEVCKEVEDAYERILGSS